MSNDCAGLNKCHGCMKWCVICGDVDHVCDVRLEGNHCDEHPIPPSFQVLRTLRRDAEKMTKDGESMIRDGKRVLTEVEDEERARRAYDLQVAAEERRIFGTKRN